MTLFFTFIIVILAFINFVYIPIYISWRYNDVRKQKIDRVKEIHILRRNGRM